jgi:hypothetical protein
VTGETGNPALSVICTERAELEPGGPRMVPVFPAIRGEMVTALVIGGNGQQDRHPQRRTFARTFTADLPYNRNAI